MVLLYIFLIFFFYLLLSGSFFSSKTPGKSSGSGGGKRLQSPKKPVSKTVSLDRDKIPETGHEHLEKQISEPVKVTVLVAHVHEREVWHSTDIVARALA